jgi:hypothetical protein
MVAAPSVSTLVAQQTLEAQVANVWHMIKANRSANKRAATDLPKKWANVWNMGASRNATSPAAPSIL